MPLKRKDVWWVKKPEETMTDWRKRKIAKMKTFPHWVAKAEEMEIRYGYKEAKKEEE